MSPPLMKGATGVLALADGTVSCKGIGVGAAGEAVGEVCFNTAMTGYQEILTDPSYMAQIVAFTFPHVGNVGVNLEDIEQFGQGAATSARGAIFRDLPTPPANWRGHERPRRLAEAPRRDRPGRGRHPRADPAPSARAACRTR